MTTYKQGEFMKRGFLIIGLCIALTHNGTFAEEMATATPAVTQSAVAVKEDYTPQLLTKIKGQREVIYNSLGLTQAQLKAINELETRRYTDLEPLLKKLCCAKNKEKKLSATPSASDEEIKSAQKELNKVRKDIKKVTNSYDSKMKKILTHDQWTKYLIIRKLKQQDLNKLNSDNKPVSPYKKSDLRPFGVPISQPEYAEQLKQERCWFGKLKKK